MLHDSYSDEYLLSILNATKVIAMVGASPKPERPSHRVMGFLLRKGLKVIPVNPGHAGQTIHDQTVYARLADVPEPFDMVEVFRESRQVPALVDEMLALPKLPRFLWMQIGVIDADGAARAEARGIKVVMNRCPAIEIPRLGIL